jgi:hypothetical protein
MRRLAAAKLCDCEYVALGILRARSHEREVHSVYMPSPAFDRIPGPLGRAEPLLNSPIGVNEGRSSESCRRLTYLVLFTADGRPGLWLLLLAVCWATVTGVALAAPN